MKKLILGIALTCFIAFGTLGLQNAVASTDNVEIVKKSLDDDPAKNKKSETKTDGKDKKAKSGENCKTNCKTSCKEVSSKCQTKVKCCPSKAAGSEADKNKEKEGGDKK